MYMLLLNKNLGVKFQGPGFENILLVLTSNVYATKQNIYKL